MNRKPPTQFQKLHATLEGLWDGSSIRLGTELSRLEKFAHFWVLVSRSFSRNRCPAHASALAYTTLLALIPMLAVVLSFTSSLLKGESEEKIDQFIERLVANVVPPAVQPTNTWPAVPEAVPEPTEAAPAATNDVVPPPSAATNELVLAGAFVATTNAPSATQMVIASLASKPEAVEARKEAARHIKRFIENTRSGALGVTGSIALVFIAISMLARIEDTFNDIWGVARGRSWFMRIVLYWSVISLAPLLLIGTLALATGPHLESTRALLVQTPFIGNFLFRLLPIFVLWLAFAAFYKLVPNTKIHWTAALAGGLVCAILWHLNNTVSVLYVSRVVGNSKIYGSLGMVPVFMIGLYLSWLILLFGAQFAYAWQNRAAYLQEKLAERIDQRGREFVALRLMTCVGQYFQSGEAAASVSELSATLGVPSRLTQQIMHTLKTAQLVSEVSGPDAGYLPARPLETITCYDILLALRTVKGQPLPRRDEPATNEVLGEFERIQAAEREAATTVTMAALVHRAQARLQLAAPESAGETAAPSALVLPVEPAQPNSGNVASLTEPEPPQTPASQDAPAMLVEPVAPAIKPPAQPRPPEFVSIRLPATHQPTEDEERSFPL